ncbi:MAG: hypothetical protein BLM47_06660 [Candidatus Reconcilbacillus cellulovorans]|uniref:Uncharacterized protein n=1 Tax=Candidatus Reconcilbacillus cellulovorans TaxID=1906605 RepID=A0A2A6E165_9BACL|nr:MAG: hypothetical protein BLM47_06660 [Candidatus Reconcilbacillus cellulovorans]
MNEDKGDRVVPPAGEPDRAYSRDKWGERPADGAAGPTGGDAMSPAWREFYEAVREAIRSTARP